MKTTRNLFVILAVLLAAVILSGCISVELKVNRDGSCEINYIIDTSQFGGFISVDEIEESFKESVEETNTRAGKTVAVLKDVKENKKDKTMTVAISVSDINEMEEGAFFGTVKAYRQESGFGLDNLVDKKDKPVAAEDIPDALYLVYLPMTEGDEYGILNVTVTVPGTIEYLTEGAELEKGNVAVFEGESVLAVFKMGGGGFPVWIVPVIAIILIILLLLKMKKPSAAPVVSPPVTTNAPDTYINTQSNS
ncbi:MAG TPA: hypothetical protein PK369_01890 [Thermoclostridium sp.]|nr:hypothetical protein [Clostridiaceae bacterium]HOQ75306.1 hypothetical protein [Thermoclostridium sp.]HPU45783.1 hypothetical protein [Thermoclostridium sp.]